MERFHFVSYRNIPLFIRQWHTYYTTSSRRLLTNNATRALFSTMNDVALPSSDAIRDNSSLFFRRQTTSPYNRATQSEKTRRSFLHHDGDFWHRSKRVASEHRRSIRPTNRHPIAHARFPIFVQDTDKSAPSTIHRHRLPMTDHSPISVSMSHYRDIKAPTSSS